MALPIFEIVPFLLVRLVHCIPPSLFIPVVPDRSIEKSFDDHPKESGPPNNTPRGEIIGDRKKSPCQFFHVVISPSNWNFQIFIILSDNLSRDGLNSRLSQHRKILLNQAILIDINAEIFPAANYILVSVMYVSLFYEFIC